MIGRIVSPSSEREYSTRGGTSGYTVRLIRSSASIDLRLSVSTFWLMPSRDFCSSIKRQGRSDNFWKISSLHLFPGTGKASVRGESRRGTDGRIFHVRQRGKFLSRHLRGEWIYYILYKIGAVRASVILCGRGGRLHAYNPPAGGRKDGKNELYRTVPKMASRDL